MTLYKHCLLTSNLTQYLHLRIVQISQRPALERYKPGGCSLPPDSSRPLQFGTPSPAIHRRCHCSFPTWSLGAWTRRRLWDQRPQVLLHGVSPPNLSLTLHRQNQRGLEKLRTAWNWKTESGRSSYLVRTLTKVRPNTSCCCCDRLLWTFLERCGIVSLFHTQDKTWEISKGARPDLDAVDFLLIHLLGRNVRPTWFQWFIESQMWHASKISSCLIWQRQEQSRQYNLVLQPRLSVG